MIDVSPGRMRSSSRLPEASNTLAECVSTDVLAMNNLVLDLNVGSGCVGCSSTDARRQVDGVHDRRTFVDRCRELCLGVMQESREGHRMSQRIALIDQARQHVHADLDAGAMTFLDHITQAVLATRKMRRVY